MFDPEEHEPKDGKRSGDDHPPLTKAGRFLVAIKSVAKKIEHTERTGAPFWRCYCEVIDGPHTGEWFKLDVFIHAKAYGILGNYTKSMRWKERAKALGVPARFDPEVREQFLRAFLFQPFNAKIEVEKRGDKTFANLKFADPPEEREIPVCDAYRDEKAERVRKALEQEADLGDSGGPSDFDDWGSTSTSRGSAKRNEFDSDDIPFVLNGAECVDRREEPHDPARIARMR